MLPFFLSQWWQIFWSSSTAVGCPKVWSPLESPIDTILVKPISCTTKEDSIRLFTHIQDHSSADLRALAREHGIDLSDCIEQHEIVNRIASAVSLLVSPHKLLSQSTTKSRSSSSIRLIISI
jgi:hypothetical protein